MNSTTYPNKIFNFLLRSLTIIVVSAFSLMLTIMAIQIISRYVLGMAVPWTSEVSSYLFIAEIFLGSVLALHYQEHIRITVVFDILPKGARKLADLISDLLTIIVLLMLVAGAWNMMERTAGVFASTFDMSFSYIYLIQMASAIMMLLLTLNNMQRHLRGKESFTTNELGSE